MIFYPCMKIFLFYWNSVAHKCINKLDHTLYWRQNDHSSVSNHQPHGCLLNRLFKRRSKKTSKLRVTGLCEENSPGPVNSPHKRPVTRKIFLFDDVIIFYSDNGLSPVWCRAIIGTNAGLLSMAPLGTNFRIVWIKIQPISCKTKKQYWKCRLQKNDWARTLFNPPPPPPPPPPPKE